jgi:hypothetical protein
MQPITLENGIANIDIIAESVRPPGMELYYEAQVNGVWRRLNEEDSNILTGLPALLPFRLVFVGTQDNHCAIALGSPSTVFTWRPRTDFKHVSSLRTLPSPCDEIEVRVLAEWWEAGRHTIDIDLLTGSPGYSVGHNADSVEIIPQLDLNGVIGRVEFRAHYLNLSPALSNYKIRITGTTNSALATYHLAGRVDIAFNSA